MSSSDTTALRRRVNHMLEQLERHAKPLAHAFVLLGNAEIAPDARAKIGPRDTVYVKRIVLVHG